MLMSQRATVRGATDEAQIQLVRNGDLAVTAAELTSSYLNEALSAKGFPKELAEILGTCEIMLARAIDSQGHIAATAIDLVRAETMMAIYKSELRSQGRSDEEIAMAAAAGGLNLNPIWAVPAPVASAPSNVSQRLTLVIAPAHRPGGSGLLLKPYMAVYVNIAGYAAPASPSEYTTIGLVASIDGSTCTVALPGDLLTTDISTWTIGDTYFPNVDGTALLVKWGDVPAVYTSLKACARAVKADQLLVIDGVMYPHMQVLNGLI